MGNSWSGETLRWGMETRIYRTILTRFVEMLLLHILAIIVIALEPPLQVDMCVDGRFPSTNYTDSAHSCRLTK